MDKLKTRILLISLLLVLLASAQAVAATTNDDGNATSESIDFSICDNTDDISSDKLSNNPDDILSASNELDILSVDEATYSDLENEISQGRNIVELQQDYYTYDESGSTISISGDNRIIDGVGATEFMYSGTAENLKVGTFTDLDDKIFDAIANHDGILNLTYDFAYDEDIDGEKYALGVIIKGNTALTINGNNHTISGSKLSGILYIEIDDNVATFNNITFANAYASAITNLNGKLIINNCTFINNINFYDGGYDEGGAISNWDNGLTITDSVFINNTAKDGGAIYIEGTNITVTNCVFINNSAVGDGIDSGTGGAIGSDGETFIVNNCVFTNNIASTSAASADYVPQGGAISGFDGIITNSSFTDNSADNGGAIRMYSGGNIINCSFTGNNASSGSAIYFNKPEKDNSFSVIGDISNSRFLNNRADADEFYVTKNKNSITITFTGKDNLLNALYSEVDVKLTNVTYWGAKGVSNTGSSPIIPSKSNKESGQNITVFGVVNGNILNTTKVTDAEGKIVLDDVYGVYNITVRHDADSYYTKAEKIIVNKINTKVSAEDISRKASEKTDIKVKIVDENGNPVKNGTASLTIDSKTYTAEVVDGIATFKDVVIPKNDTVADVYYHGNDYYNSSSTTFSIIVKHDNHTDGNKTVKHISSNVYDERATGNPIAIMLLALCAMIITYRKK